MVVMGTIGAVLSAIDLLKEVLETAGVDRSKVGHIIAEFLSKLKLRGGSAKVAGQGSQASGAFVQETWEYGVVTFSYHKPWRGTKSLVVQLRDGVEVSEKEVDEPAAYLNRAVEDGWEVLTTLGGDVAPTLILRREKRL